MAADKPYTIVNITNAQSGKVVARAAIDRSQDGRLIQDLRGPGWDRVGWTNHKLTWEMLDEKSNQPSHDHLHIAVGDVLTLGEPPSNGTPASSADLVAVLEARLVNDDPDDLELRATLMTEVEATDGMAALQ
jgi:hypothetical protein